MRVEYISRVKILTMTVLALVREVQSTSCSKQNPTPKITIHGVAFNSDRYTISYGEDVIIYCSSEDISNLRINDEKVQHTKIKETTIQLYEKKPKLGIYAYSCWDTKTNCRDSLTIEVHPTMSVKSTIVHYKLDEEYGMHLYYIPLGAEYEVFCTGNNDQPLRIYLQTGFLAQTEDVDEITVKYTTKANKAWDTIYLCKSKVRTEKGEMEVQERIAVSADYFPRSEKFECFIFDLISSVLECSWFYLANYNSYQLYFTDHDDHSDMVPLCSNNFGKNTATCKVNELFMGRKLFKMNHKVSFVLKSCNWFICNNETFTMNTNTITQLKAIKKIDVGNTSPRSAVLAWKNCDECLYKIRYRLPNFEDQWRKADTSSVRCVDTCEFELIFPYPDTKYAVEVQAKNKQASTRLWSDPVPIFVTTEPRPACRCDQQQAPSTQKTSCEPCTLIEDSIEANMVILKKVKTLYEKLNKINMLSELLEESKLILNRINDLG